MGDVAQNQGPWWIKAILVGAVISLASMLISATGTRIGLWPFFGPGTMLLGASVVLASAVMFLGLIAYVVCWVKGWSALRPGVLVSLILSLCVLWPMGSMFMTMTSLPVINDISTDTIDPPKFNKLVAIRQAANANPLNYDADALVEQQQSAYPWVESLSSAQSPEIMMRSALKAVEELGLDVIDVDPAAGLIEASATSFWFGFTDDLVIRVRAAEAGGSLLDIRSVSRVGRSDFGQNAKRIGAILEVLR